MNKEKLRISGAFLVQPAARRPCGEYNLRLEGLAVNTTCGLKALLCICRHLYDGVDFDFGSVT